MQSFTHYTPTEIIFGKDTEWQVGKTIEKWGGTKVLIVYGGGSVVQSGLLESVKNSVKESGITYVELGGVQPNPRLSLAEGGVALAVKEQVDFILAVGGGSVIDTAKGIAHGAARPECKLWDLWMKKEKLGDSLPVGCILTIPAAGSEMSDSAVLTNTEVGKKAGLSTELNRPRFAILNPELAFSLPKYQIACGITDIMMHTMERYFIPESNCQMTDEIAEGLLRTVIANGRKVMADSHDYESMSELMWCGSLSHNGITGLGRDKDFSVHKLGHALGARYDYAHGATLACVWGAWANYLYQYDIQRFAQYAEKVWGVVCKDKKQAAEEGISKTIEYFREIGMPVNLREIGISEISEEELMELALDATMKGTVKLAKIKALNVNDVFEIFKNAKGE